MGNFGIGRRIAAAVAACAAVAALSACSVSASGGKSVKQAEVEKQIADQLAAKTGERPTSVSCPDNLKAKEGTTMRCTLTARSGKYGLTVTVTSVKDNTVNFDIKVDDKPTP